MRTGAPLKKLLDCPFCGSKPEYYFIRQKDEFFRQLINGTAVCAIACSYCGATMVHDDPNTLTKIWNHRKGDPPPFVRKQNEKLEAKWPPPCPKCMKVCTCTYACGMKCAKNKFKYFKPWFIK